MALTLAQMVAAVKRDLKTTNYNDSQLEDIIEQYVLPEVSDVSPYQAVEVLPVKAKLKTLDISGITNLLEIRKVEYPVTASPRSFRKFEKIDNETIEVDIASPFAETGTQGTLTGTVTFASGSATVTGSGTDFDGELAAGSFIKVSTGTRWYRVYSIESDTSLTLEETVKSADAGADTLNSTIYLDYGARVYCNKLHTLSTTSTLNAKEERVVELGSVAKAASLWLNRTKELINSAEDRLTDNSTIEQMADRITQAIDDLTSARTHVNTIAVGGRPQADYIAISMREIQNAVAYANETGAFLRESQQYLNMGNQVRAYQAYVDRTTLEYRTALKTIVKRKVSQSYSRS